MTISLSRCSVVYDWSVRTTVMFSYIQDVEMSSPLPREHLCLAEDDAVMYDAAWPWEAGMEDIRPAFAVYGIAVYH